MNKRPNPFMPNPYAPQPPLPAGPPPPGPPQQQQYDYSAYWAAAQQSHAAPSQAQWAPPTVGTQAPQPPPRTSDQSALYANYGYGGAAGQQQAMLAAQQQRPAAPYWPPAPGYAPVAGAPYPYTQQPPAYQPQPPPPAAIPYTPQAAPPIPVYQPHAPQAPPPPPPQRRFQPQQAQPHHHLPAPPAKRPRFDSGPPNPSSNNNPSWRPNNSNNSNSGGGNGIPTAPAQHGNFPVQQPGFERFSHSSRGRGGGVMLSNNNNRGRGFNRGGGGGGGGGYGRHGNNPPRGPSGYRNPGPSGAPYGPRHGLPANPVKRERESKREREREREGSYAESDGAMGGGERGHGGKRTLTDFRIVGVECEAIGWEWGVLDRVKDEKEKPKDQGEDKEKDKELDENKVKEEPTSPIKTLPPKTPQPAPSRLRIYFHSASDPEADALPRKRKKDVDEEDEDGGVRKKVQGSDELREESKEPEKPTEKDDKPEEILVAPPEETEDHEKIEEVDDDAEGEIDNEAFKGEQEALQYPMTPDEQDTVSHKPPPTPGEDTPVDIQDHHGSSVDISLVDGQIPTENGPEEHPAESTPAPSEGNPVALTGVLDAEAQETNPPTADATTTADHPTTEENGTFVVSEADISVSTIAPDEEPIAFPSLDDKDKTKDASLARTTNGTAARLPDRSANRISISYANSTRRLVIDADVVKRVKIIRAKARVEITLEVVVVRSTAEKVEPDDKKDKDVKDEDGQTAKVEDESENKDEKLVLGEHDRFRGVEAYNDSTQRYELITPHTATLGGDLTIPDLSKVGRAPAEITVVVHLDRDKPLTETKWVKTGDLDEWLSNEFGPLRPDPSGRASWSGKIEVADPDPAPTITTLMEAWCGHTMVGQPKERRRFVRQHMSNIDHILEILLRLVRGERATAGGSGGGHHGGQQQTHVSLAVLAIFRVATDYGARAGIERQVVEERVSEIVRALPTHLVYKSLDGMFREWSFSQKKGDKGGSRDKT
ncbi:Protein IWS1 [Ceratobasidium theobromae]|uniref:Protein IWS1 n=1 Tax=Ceratobasidium theobromae TaxID=1582974 RepID=A0A5N5QE66_9AGAM|nr:Protein IWS1 [Ceratobasidium theobromae]